MKSTFVFDEEAMNEINEYDIGTIRSKIHEMDSIEKRIEFLEISIEKVNEILYIISTDIEEYFSDEGGNDQDTQKNISVANYKQLVLRNSRYFLVEELIIWKNELILNLKNELAELKKTKA
ncbi:MAG: hypothetical protein V1773_16135 [bacterium]